MWKTNVEHMLNFDIFLPDEVKKILDKFYKRKEIQKLGADYGLDGKANNISMRNILLLLRLQLCLYHVGLDTQGKYIVVIWKLSLGGKLARCSWRACVKLSFVLY